MKLSRISALTLLLLTCVTFSRAWAELVPVRLLLGKRELIVSPAAVHDGNRVLAPLSAVTALGATYAASTNGRTVQVVAADGASGDVNLVDVKGAQMVGMDDLLRVTGGLQSWDEELRALTLKAQVKSVEYSGDTLKVNCSFPVNCKVSVWSGHIMVDVADAELATAADTVSVDSSLVTKVRLGQYDGSTARVVLDLAKDAGHRLLSRQPANQIVLQVGEDIPRAAVAKPQAVAPKLQPYTIESIRLVSADEKYVGVVIGTSSRAVVSSAYGVNPPEVELTFSNATLASGLAGMEDAHPLLAKLTLSQASRGPGTARITLSLSRIVAYSVVVDEKTVTVNVRIPDKAGGTLEDKLVVVDPGHGGREKGAVCAGICEKDVNVKLAKALVEALNAAGARAMLAREGDEVVRLAARSEVAINNGADFFISMHCNSNYSANSATGIETYYHMREPSPQALAYAIHVGVCSSTGMCDRKAKSDRTLPYSTGLGVLRRLTGSGIPGVLLECGFMNHSSDRTKLLSADYRVRLADGIVAGLRAYVEGTAIR